MKKVFVLSALILFLWAIIMFPDVSSNAVKNSLLITSLKMIPSIFPLMVMGEVLSEQYFRNFKGSVLNKCIFIFILSNLCGFPLGCRLSSRLKGELMLTEKQCVLLSVLSNNASPTFVILFVGEGLYSSKSVGVTVYFVQLFSSVLSAFVFYLINKKELIGEGCRSIGYKENVVKNFTDSFRDAVTDAAGACLNIASFIAMFSVITEYVQLFTDKLNVMHRLSLAFSSFFELTRGCIDAARLPAPFSLVICSFCIGFSGLSLILQSTFYLQKEGVRSLSFIFHKLLQGFTAALLMSFIFGVITDTSAVLATSVQRITVSPYALLLSAVTVILYFISIFIHFYINKKKSQENS